MTRLMKTALVLFLLGFSHLGHAFMPLICTSNDRTVKRFDILPWEIVAAPDVAEKAIIYFIDNSESAERRLALYRARDIFNQNASEVKIQLIETHPSNPVVWPFYLDSKNKLLFRNNGQFPFYYFQAKGLALSVPLCVLGTNAITKALVYLNDTTGRLSESVTLDDGTTDIGKRLVESRPWAAYPYINRIFKYWTLPPGITRDEQKIAHDLYGGGGESIVSLALHELGHPFGMNHEGREMNNMGYRNASAHGYYLLDWIGEDMTQFLVKNYPRTTSTYIDLSVRHIRWVSSQSGYKIGASSPVYQTDYANVSRTLAYTGPDKANSPALYVKSAGVFLDNDYFSNPLACMVKGEAYYVEFSYENNSSIDAIGAHQVTFFLSEDAEIVPDDPLKPDVVIDQAMFVSSLASGSPKDMPIGPFDVTTDTVNPRIKIDFSRDPATSVLDPAAKFDFCYEPFCTISVRRSTMFPVAPSDPAYELYSPSNLALTKRSTIKIPAISLASDGTPDNRDIPVGNYFIGVYVGPVPKRDAAGNIVTDVSGDVVNYPDDNPTNNTTYMEVKIVNSSIDCL